MALKLKFYFMEGFKFSRQEPAVPWKAPVHRKTLQQSAEQIFISVNGDRVD